MGFAGAGPADEHGIALLGDEATTGEVIDERLVDWRIIEVEVIPNISYRPLADCAPRWELVLVSRRRELSAAVQHFIGIARRHDSSSAIPLSASLNSEPKTIASKPVLAFDPSQGAVSEWPPLAQSCRSQECPLLGEQRKTYARIDVFRC